MTLFDNMWFIYKPEIDGLRYDLDGVNIIISDYVDAPSIGNGSLFRYSNIKEESYNFNKDFKLEYVLDRDYNELNINSINQQEIINEMYQFAKSVIDAQPEPTINLQWLYNLFYGNALKNKFEEGDV